MGFEYSLRIKRGNFTFIIISQKNYSDVAVEIANLIEVQRYNGE